MHIVQNLVGVVFAFAFAFAGDKRIAMCGWVSEVCAFFASACELEQFVAQMCQSLSAGGFLSAVGIVISHDQHCSSSGLVGECASVYSFVIAATTVSRGNK